MSRFKVSRIAMLGALLFMATASFAGTTIPGKIEAEAYTTMSGVKLEACSEGTQNVGWIDTNDWMDYEIKVSTAGSFTIQYRVASPGTVGIIASSYNGGATQLGTVSVPNTGGWQNWQTISQTVTLPVGTYKLAVFAQSGGFNLNWINIASNDSASAVAQLYQNTNYGGYVVNLAVGNYAMGLLQAMGMKNDDISSLKVASGYRVELYSDDSFGGTKLVKTGDDPNLIDDGFNDVLSSVKVMAEATTTNVILPANGGKLVKYTSQYGSSWVASDLTDGITNDDGWSSLANPGAQAFVYSFKDGGSATLKEAVIYSGTAEGAYFSKSIEVWTSADGTKFTKAANGTLANSVNSITLNLGNVVAKKVKLVITSGYRTDYWELGEFVVNGTLASGGSQTEFNLSYKTAPADNPLKGFMPYEVSTSAFPHSTEWFYIPLKDIQTDYNAFNWSVLDNHINAIANRGHQAVFGVYLDYPDKPYGMPGFLSGVSKYSYSDYGNGTHATSYCPDYNNANLQQALLNFIQALGARYDNDPRIGFIHTGLLGFWGEWHTYPHTEWMATSSYMNKILDAYESAFPNTLIQLREPKGGVTTNRSRLGFHDDSFAYETLGPTDWHFWPKMTAAGLQDCWKTRPIGGELRPEVQACIWDDSPCTPAGQDFSTCVTTTHASLLLNNKVFLSELGSTQIQRATVAAQSLGYALHIPKATLNSFSTSQVMQGTVTIENRGVAPFYYHWPVQVAVMNSSGQIRGWVMDWDLRKILPSSPVTWTFNVSNHGLASGNYTLLIGVPNPMVGGHALKFANTTQDQHRSDWLTLGTFTVQQ